MRRNRVLLIAALSAYLINTPSKVLAAADQCVLKPKPGSAHWYYHVDAVTHRKCWFVGQPKVQARPAAPSRAAHPAVKHPVSEPKPAGTMTEEKTEQIPPAAEEQKNPEPSYREKLFREFVLWQILHAEH
jgi:hypothetical protein